MMPWERDRFLQLVTAPDEIPACIRRDANNRAPFMREPRPPGTLPIDSAREDALRRNYERTHVSPADNPPAKQEAFPWTK